MSVQANFFSALGVSLRLRSFLTGISLQDFLTEMPLRSFLTEMPLRSFLTGISLRSFLTTICLRECPYGISLRQFAYGNALTEFPYGNALTEMSLRSFLTEIPYNTLCLRKLLTLHHFHFYAWSIRFYVSRKGFKLIRVPKTVLFIYLFWIWGPFFILVHAFKCF